ncbi:tannase/feruloyl esterase family alpha/beta hydrolase [Streptomyces sp. NPDC051985]|uniref:tannase/feruloyl esterase family alpha/beta hydrolase n=1 Tax=Streptomyces sp. NPDC051985 TaxID=3155807 RepID=UPI003419C01C
MEKVTLASAGLAQWVAMDDVPTAESAAERCTVGTLQSALDGLMAAEVVSATVNRSGEFQAPPPHWSPVPGNPFPDPPLITGLPDFCDVRIRVPNPGGHVAEVAVWVPLRWNGRFLGTAGAGSQTGHQWHDYAVTRSVTMPAAVRNGFATATTDGANRDPRFVDWALRRDTGELDWELINNWVHRSTHEMTVLGKAVTGALHGSAPRFSYLAGCSGGGRQVLVSAQRHPQDYDGIWAVDPAINWTRFAPADLWPALVMKEHRNPLPEAKLEAFRDAAIEVCDGADGLRDGIVGAFDPCEYDPRKLVGARTPAGEITEADAEVMRKIWEGPRRRDGEALWYGLRPGGTSWGEYGLCVTTEADGELVPLPFAIAPSYFRWVLQDPEFDWTTLTFERYEELFDQGVRELADIAGDDPELSGLRDSGGKLIISQAADDAVIFFQGTVDYYRRVMDAMGGEERTTSFARLFVSDGDVHGMCVGRGPGLTMAGGMTALMDWVENGNAPEVVVAERVDAATGSVTATRPVYPYPAVTRYSGSGDPDNAASFTSRRLPEQDLPGRKDGV